jgi:hypothetical protein
MTIVFGHFLKGTVNFDLLFIFFCLFSVILVKKCVGGTTENANLFWLISFAHLFFVLIDVTFYLLSYKHKFMIEHA